MEKLQQIGTCVGSSSTKVWQFDITNIRHCTCAVLERIFLYEFDGQLKVV